MSKQKSIPQRDAIPQEYTWNTADLYPNDQAWQEDFSRLASTFLGWDVAQAVEQVDISQY